MKLELGVLDNKGQTAKVHFSAAVWLKKFSMQ